jgi:L-iditol 2-dehydrogenase
MATIPKTCKAAVINRIKEPVSIEEVNVPQELEPGAMLVRTDVASLCGSDIHMWDGTIMLPIEPFLPIIPGHEMMGTIVDRGEVRCDAVGQPLAEGDRIIWSPATCGQCFWCRITKQESLCPNRRNYNFASCRKYPYLVGGLSQYCYVYPTSGKIKIPGEVKSEWASAASCALRTVVHAFEKLGAVRDYDTVVVQGAGPVGLFATAMASKAGASRVVTIGAPQARLDIARRWGANHQISVEKFNTKERQEQVMALTGGRGADIVIEASGAKPAFREGIDMVRRGGRYLVIGQTNLDEVSIAPSGIVGREMTVIGSLSAETTDYYKAMEFMRNNRDRFDFDAMVTARYPLSKVNDAYEAMRNFSDIKPIVLPHA